MALSAPAAAAAAPTARVDRWDPVPAAAFVGDALIAVQTPTRVVRAAGAAGRPGPVQFTYYETVALRAGLTRSRTSFTRPTFSSAVTIRSSIASMSGATLGAGPDAFVVVPGALGGPPPVVWCCTARNEEVVLESDGRPGARTVVAAGIDGARVRMLARNADGTASLLSSGPAALPDPDAGDASATTATLPGRPAAGTSAVMMGTAVWTDAPGDGVLTVADVSDAGAAVRLRVAVGGPIVAVRAADGLAVVVVRTGARAVRVTKVDTATGRWRVVWRGSRVPRVAVGGGMIAVADRSAIVAGRGDVLRRVRIARGPVAAVAATTDRVAWLEQVTVKASGVARRRTVARLAVVSR